MGPRATLSRLSGLVPLVLAAVLLLGSGTPVQAGGSAPVEIDPFIQALVDSVSTSRLMDRITTMANFYTRHTWSDTTLPTTGIGAARKWVKAEFDTVSAHTGGELTSSYFSWLQLGRLARNVYAELPGTMPESADRIFGIDGHLDSRNAFIADATGLARGANDDATGVAATMEAAWLMAPYDWETTLEFHAFAGEEEGLHGSKHYAVWADTTGKNIEGWFALDIVGGITNEFGQSDSLRLRSFADTTLSCGNMQRYIKRVSGAYVPQTELVIKRKRDRTGRGSDHLSFSDNGFTAIRLIEMRENLAVQHTPRDSVVYVNPNYFTRSVRVALASLASLALSPAPPGGLTVEETAEGNIRLSWPTTNDEPDFAGYMVAYRFPDPPEALLDTSVVGTSAYTMVDVGLVNEHVLVGPDEGDSVYVGIAAVDDGGHESLVSPDIGIVFSVATGVPGTGPEPLLLGLGEPRPNPASGTVEFALSIGGADAQGQLGVFDAQGRRVRRLVEGSLVAGVRTLTWDLRDDLGRRVPAGVYFFRLQASGATTSRKVVVSP